MKDKVIGVRLQEEDVVRIKAKIGEGSISNYIRWLIDFDLNKAALDFDDSASRVHGMYEKTSPSLHRPRDLGEHPDVDIPLIPGTSSSMPDPQSLRNG